MPSIIFTWQSQVRWKYYNWITISIIKITILYECYIFLLFTFLTAENIAEKYAISREAQDYYASKSQQKAETAINAGYFVKEIIPVTIAGKKESIVISKDEFPKFGTTAEKLAKLRPAFRPVCKYYFFITFRTTWFKKCNFWYCYISFRIMAQLLPVMRLV